MGRISRADLLVLDDFGVERTTEYAIEQSYEIVNTRYKSGKPMVITTNLTLQEMQQEPLLQKRRIFDRVIEKCIPVLVQGDSRRREIAEAKRREAMTLLEGSV
jgi:DNA replication protein DnaC